MIETTLKHQFISLAGSRVPRAVGSAALVVVMLASCLQAAEINWTNAAGGDFHTAGNWSPNTVPGTNDVAIFNVTAGPYTVTWSAPATNFSVKVPEGTVTWNLQGNLYGLNRYSTNSVGTVSTTTDLTITNGTVQRLNHGYLGSFAYSFKLKGPGTTLRLLAGGEYLYAYYAEYGSGTHLIVDGANARFATGGFYSRECKGSMVATNGGFLEAAGGFPSIGAGADIRVSGPGYVANLGPRNLNSGATILLDGDATVKGYAGHSAAYYNPSVIGGTLTLDDARLYYYTSTLNAGLRMTAPGGILQGDGEVEYGFVEIAGGVVRPGGTNSAGLLACKGNFTNSTGTGSIDIELGGTNAAAHDRLTFAAGAGGSGTFYAGGDLDVTLINGFTLTDGDTFDILDFVSAAGTFDSVSLPGNPWDWDTTALYTTGEITYSILAVMPVPTNVAATDGAFEDKVQVTWDAVAPATGYEIWRSLSAATGTAARVGTAVAMTYDDTTTTAMVTNYYWIKATNATLVSTFSDADSGWKIAALPVPAVPTNVAASDGVYAYQGKVVVTWDAAADATGYEVWRNATADTGTAVRIGTPSGTTFDDTTAVINVTNVYWVKSTNPAHTSGFSDEDTGWRAPIPPFEIVWANPAGGDFQTPANWDPQFVPTATNRAVFDLTNGPYTVTWSESVSNSSFRVREGTVTWDLQGYAYDVDALSSACSVGTDTTTVDLTVTNGTLRSSGVNHGNRLQIRGPGTVLRILEADCVNLAYPYVYATLFVGGPNASFDTLGYSRIYGEVIVTNGAYITASDATSLHGSGSLKISGSSSSHSIAPSTFDAGASLYLGGGAVVNEAYIGNNPRRTPVKGRLTFDDARYTGGYADSYLGLIDANAILEGDGRLVFVAVENLFGAIRPGGSNSAGLLVTEGVSNAVAGAIDIELGGTDTNDYDRLHAVDGVRGDGEFWAGGTLNVTLTDSFVPEDDTFDILDFVTMHGAFDTVSLPGKQGWWDTNSLYVTGEITYVPPPRGTIILVR